MVKKLKQEAEVKIWQAGIIGMESWFAQVHRL
jgi:hypothetical protein